MARKFKLSAALLAVLFLCCWLVQDAGAQCGSASPGFPQLLRLHYNTSGIRTPPSSTSCDFAGEVLLPLPQCFDRKDTNYTCTAGDVINLTLFDACAVPAMAAVAERLQNSLCVNRSGATSLVHQCDSNSQPLEAPYDHVVFLTMFPCNPRPEIVAQTQSCVTAPNGRPLSSTINIEPQTFNAMNFSVSDCYQYAYNMLLHFTTHALGFDFAQMAAWENTTDASGGPVKYIAQGQEHWPVQPVDEASRGVMATATSHGLYNASMISATRRVMLVTRRLVETARTHFSCPTLGGVWLEELNPFDLHFERRQMTFEAMTTEFRQTAAPAWSKFAMAALEDTGWYRRSDSPVLDAYEWGRGMGCEFLRGCTPSSWGSVFCNGTFGISFDLRFGSACRNFDMQSNFLLPPYTHFSNPTLGGWDPYADYCPYAGNVSVTSALYPSPVVAPCFERRTSNDVGANFSTITGWGSRAVRSTIASLTTASLSRSLHDAQPRCMQLLCLNESYMMFRAGDSWYPCVPDGAPPGTIPELTYPPSADTPNRPLGTFPATVSYFFYGQLQCPPLSTCNVDRTKSDLYGVGGFLSARYFPKLLSITPTSGSVGGGTRVTVSGLNFRGQGPISITCRGVAIGGQPTNASSYEDYGVIGLFNGQLVYSFAVNTTYVPSVGLLGGPFQDGSGPADVELLCTISNGLVCGNLFGDLGLCGVDRVKNAFVLEPLPEPPAPPSYSATSYVSASLSATDSATLPFLVVGPVPVLAAVASATAAIVSVSQWLSAAGGGGAASSLGRATAAQRLQLCSIAGSSHGGLLGVSIGESVDPEHTTRAARWSGT